MIREKRIKCPAAVLSVILTLGGGAGLCIGEAASQETIKVSVFIGHGRKDAQVDPEASRKAKAYLEERGFAVILDEFEGGHSMTGDVVRRAQAWMNGIGMNDETAYWPRILSPVGPVFNSPQ